MKIPPRLLRWLLLLAPLLFASTVVADETDIYYTQSTIANPNILFVLDNSGSMNCTDPKTGAVITSCLSGGKTRMEVLKSVFSSVMDNVPSTLNIGLMRYGGHQDSRASGVSFPAKPVDLDKDGNGSAWDIINARIAPGLDNLPNPTGVKQPVREFLKDVVNDWKAEGYTPIVDALYEAALYYRGEAVNAGRLQPNHVRAAHPASYTGNLTVNPNGDCSEPTSCVKDWGECYQTIVPNSCRQETRDVCNWGILAHDGCCWQSTGVDEGGNATGGYCASYTCPRYGCLDTPHPGSVEVCQQYTCRETIEGAAVYNSPIQHECQSNYIVLMSDGRPEYSGGGSDGGINKYPDAINAIETLTAKGNSCGNDAPNGYKSGTCGPELTKYLLTKDQAPTVDGEQFIQTFTIGFGLEDTNATNYLKALASVDGGAFAVNDAEGLKLAFENVIKKVQDKANPKQQLAGTPAFPTDVSVLVDNKVTQMAALPGVLTPEVPTLANLTAYEQQVLSSLFNPYSYVRTLAAGGFFAANDTQTLLDAFSSIINKVTASASSFSSPTYQIDQGSLLAHSEYVYVPVFDRSNLPLWPGNLKKFKRDSTGKLIDANGNVATDEQGVFKDGAQDLWSTTPDGKDVTKGGAANKLPLPDSRKLYTDVGSSKDLTDASNRLSAANTALLGEFLGESGPYTTVERKRLIDFAIGKKADGTPRYHMGDSLNSKPQIVFYGSGAYIFMGTNEGFLHAIDADTGVEKWAFMPKALLKNVETFYENTKPKKHISGIDAPLTVWRKQYDSNGDGSIGGTDAYKTYLYFGLRQGGREYYMLDVTDIDKPKIVWHIDANTNTDFAELGQTWSKPAPAKMRLPTDASYALSTTEDTTYHYSKPVDVLVFGGGYDPIKNNENTTAYTRPADSKGRDVFIINAETGDLIWSLRRDVTGAAAKLNDSIPGDIRVLDMDRNGSLDRLYFADTGGHIWRVDMDTDVSDGLPAGADTWYNYTKATLSEFADLGGTGLNKRMFFYEPDVALMRDGNKTVLTLAIGSGYRTRPLSQGDDRFYVLVDRQPYSKTVDTTIFPIKEDAKLVSLTNPDGTDNTSNIGGSKTLLTETGLNGWYYDLPNDGEKVLAPALTFLNKVMFTSFSSGAGNSEGLDPCSAPPNSARAYVIDLFNGEAVADLDRKDGDMERFVIAGINEILDAPQIVFRAPTAADGSACTKGNCGTQITEVRIGKMNLPLLDSGNTSTKISVGDILPRMFWREDLQGK